VAARLRRALGIEVEQVAGDYGEFRVLVDDRPVIEAGALGFLGLLPGTRAIREAVERALSPR
jgi:hypothetical protein